MKIAVLGTGIVGRTLAAACAGNGHDVVIGTRDPAATLARTEADAMGTPPFAQWQETNPAIPLVPYAAAGAHGDLVINATSGAASLSALTAAADGAGLAGRVVLDVANPLDFSEGFPPTLSVSNTDSLAEQIQAALPDAHVVKSLNTMSAAVMVEPGRLSGPHVVFVAGNNDGAKATVTGLLGELGWPAGQVLDLGGLRTARGTEMFLPLWLSMMGSLGTGDFNIAVARS